MIVIHKHVGANKIPPHEILYKTEIDEHPERRLTGIFRRDGHYYEIACTSSSCKTKCHFSHPFFGEAVFDRKSETLLTSTRPIDDDYLLFLTRAVVIWKRSFSSH